MADPGSLNDALFMPPQHGNTFDFALAFEHGMFTILPASLLIIITPLLLYYYTRRPIMVDYGWLFCAKIVCAICLLSIKVSILMLWIKCVHNTMLSIIASSIDCGAALCAAIILGVEHRYSFRPSSVLSVYFTLTILFDIAMARSCIRRSNLGLYTQGLLFILSAAFRGVLLILQERSKRRRIIDPDLRNSLGAESISNFWSRSLLIWLNKTLFLGFQKVLELDDLEDLGPELLSTHLNERFSHIWASTRKDSTHCLAKACIKSLIWPAFTIIIPRLSFTAFIFSQPLLLLQIVHFLGEAEQDISPSYAYGLIGATVIVYLGIVVSRALYTHLGFCLVTSARGILMSQILRKSLTLEYSKAKQNAAVTLISTDIESITSDLPRLIEFTVSSIEVGVGIYLLNTVIGNAAFLIFIPFLIFTLGAKYIGARMSPASISWNEKTQHRVSQIALVMKHITGIKILGLDSAIMEYFQHLRIVETKALQKFRMLGLIVVTMVNFGVAVTPVIVIAGIIFLPSSTRFSAAEAFTTISIILSLTEPLGLIISGYSRLRMILACLQRIQAFLLQDERKDNRTAMPVRPFLRDDFNETAGGSATPNYNIALLNSDIIIQAWQISIQDQSADRYLLKDASFAIQKSTLTIIKGAIGSGKSLLLRAILGEVNFEGTLSMVDTGMIAYYDQTPWIRYASIRDNIVGNVATYDAAWYNTVVEACFLTNDLLQLPEGDNTLAGSEGVSLSGGQKQRVALARAIYSQAEILVLDDPLSGLDQYTLRGIVSNLFGAEGILKQLQTTVIIATHSAYYTEFASMIISLDGIGNLATTQLTRGAQQSEQAISTIFDVMEPSADGFIHAETNSITESDTDVSEKEDAETLRLIEAQEDTLRRKDDLALYLFYIRSTKRWMVMVWFVAVTLTTLSETFPTVYVRIWLEVDANNNIYFVGYAFLGLLCCILTAVTIWFYFTHVITNSINTLHKKLLDTMLRATPSYLTSTDSGLIINRFSQDISLASRELPRAAFVFVYSVSQTTFAVVVILSGARFAAAFLPLIILMLYVFQHFYLRISRQMRYLDLEAKTPLYTHLAETATGIYHIRSYGVVAEVLENGLELLDISQKPFYYMFCIQRWMLVGTDMVSLGVATILVSFAVLRRDTSQAAIGLSLANLVGLSYYTSTVIQTWTDLGTSLGAIARIRNFSRDTPIEQEINEETPQDWPQQGHIVLSNLTAIYSSTDVPHEVLRDISLEIMPGQKISIIGRTGSGKSSLLLAILNFLDCTGSIYIDGRDIATISQRKLRSKITTITQTPISLNASTRYNLLPFQLERDNEMSRFHDAEAVEVLCRIRLWHHIATHGGLDAPISAMGFSSGQLQILSIARAILHHRFTNSKVILIDEPTSSIDADMEAHIKEVLHEAFDSCTVLIVTHRLETVTQSDMILELEEGQVVRFGPPDRPSRSMSSFRYTSSLRSMSSSRSMSSFG